MHKEILVIDDNPDIRLLVSNILKEQNFLVRTAANYDQAVFEINKKLPDLAIIDIKLDKPDLDGIDLLKLILRSHVTKICCCLRSFILLIFFSNYKYPTKIKNKYYKCRNNTNTV